MFAVLIYFGRRWKDYLSKANPKRGQFIRMLVVASAATGVVASRDIFQSPPAFISSEL
jgi:hypothetical protein